MKINEKIKRKISRGILFAIDAASRGAVVELGFDAEGRSFEFHFQRITVSERFVKTRRFIVSICSSHLA